MLDEGPDKEAQRNQLIAMVIMMVFIGAWSFFFFPRAQPQPPAETPAPVVSEQAPSAPAAATTPPADGAAPAAAPAAPGELPPVAESFEESDVLLLSNEALELEFTRIGGRLKQARVVLGEGGVDSVLLVPEQPAAAPVETNFPLGLRFAGNYHDNALDHRRWDGELLPDGRGVKFSIELPGDARIEKEFRFGEAPHVMYAAVRYTNLSGAPRILGLDSKEPALSLTWGPQVHSEDKATDLMSPQKIIWHVAGINERTPTSDIEPPVAGALFSERQPGAEWAAIRNAYFSVAIKPEFERGEFWVKGTPEVFTLGAGVPRVEVAANDTLTGDYTLYVGPNQKDYLAEAWPSLSLSLEFFEWFSIMDWFAKLLLAMLNWMYANIYANYGVAIILLTILVRMVVFPLTWKSMLSMKKMQKLAPEMEQLKEEYKDNPEEFQKKMMSFYSERGVNPLGGCLPMLLQMPVFIALYRMLATSFELRHAPFAGWINDLSAPDRLVQLPFSIPMIFFDFDAINVLPILMAVTMWLSIKMTPQSSAAAMNPQQKFIMNFMPIMFSVICYNMASGLNLYILTSTLLGIAQNLVIQRMDIDVSVEKKAGATNRTAAKPKHFYNAAQAKKREIAKEARKEKREKTGVAAKGNKDRRP